MPNHPFATVLSGVPAKVLQRQPSQKEMELLCKVVGVNYVFLFLELGLEYVSVEQERANNVGVMTDQIMALLHKWEQKGENQPPTSNYLNVRTEFILTLN